MDSLNLALLEEYAQVDADIKTMKAELKRLEKRKRELEPDALTEFEQSGLQNLKTKDGTTVYVHRQLWARAKDGDKGRAVAALKSAGLGDLVSETFNTNTLSAYVRERDAEGEALDDELLDVLDVTEDFSLRCRRG